MTVITNGMVVPERKVIGEDESNRDRDIGIFITAIGLHTSGMTVKIMMEMVDSLQQNKASFNFSQKQE